MENLHNDNPPPYSEAMKQPTGATTVTHQTTSGYHNHFQDPNIGVGYMHGPSAPPSNIGFVPTYGTVGSSTTTVVTPEIIIIGGCPSCRIGVLEDNYPLVGVCCAIFFFPLGVLCCLAMKNKRCTNCGAEF